MKFASYVFALAVSSSSLQAHPNPASVLKARPTLHETGSLRLEWPAVPGLYYAVEGTDNMLDRWVAEVGAEALPAAEPWLAHTVLLLPNSNRFFRIHALPSR